MTMKTLRYANKSLPACLMCSSLILVTQPLAAEIQGGHILSQSPLPAAVVLRDAYAGVNVINLDEMGEMRGGFTFAGLDMKFGATLSTVIDSIQLDTVFNITSGGAEVVSQMLSNLAVLNDTGIMEASNSNVAGATTSTGNSERTTSAVSTTDATTAVLVGPDTGVSVSDLAPMDISLDGINNSNGYSGVVINNSKGFTAALHKLTQDAAISAIISNASSVKASHKLNVKIEVEHAKSAGNAAKAAALSKLAGGMFSKR
ncbi:hypothetical protein [Marinobacter sp.]|uniref:hypothetical protein n=1 Tax=Marinobacter sp. TaxID=50741 RepID=UPI003A93F07D